MLPTTRNKAIQCYGYLRLKQATLKSAKKCLTRLHAKFYNHVIKFGF